VAQSPKKDSPTAWVNHFDALLVPGRPDPDPDPRLLFSININNKTFSFPPLLILFSLLDFLLYVAEQVFSP
jgi:hypothetical protein